MGTPGCTTEINASMRQRIGSRDCDDTIRQMARVPQRLRTVRRYGEAPGGLGVLRNGQLADRNLTPIRRHHIVVFTEAPSLDMQYPGVHAGCSTGAPDWAALDPATTSEKAQPVMTSISPRRLRRGGIRSLSA